MPRGEGEGEVLRAPHVLEYTYHRSVGPVVGAFLTGLRDGEIFGARSSSGLMVPPNEYDPVTGEDIEGLEPLPTTGTVKSWAWAAHPLADQPLRRPFAWALITLDGADGALLHVVDAGSPQAMASGMRVEARFVPADQRRGHILDIECFVPVTGTPQGAAP